MEGIKNILFDMGGVLIDLDRMKAVKAFEALGFSDINDYLGDYGQKGAFLEMEDGQISETEFYNRIRQHIPQASNEQIAHAFMQFLQGFPVYKLKMLRDLKEQGYRMMLLSNTNPLMFPRICDTYFKQEGLSINDYFDDIFLSYELGAIKPDSKIFRKVLEISGVKAEETLFIDDSAANLEASRYFGFETYLAPQNSDFSSVFHLNEI
ncbi:MAG: HAD family hydrolase [Bacteroidales bacterium]